MRKFDITFIGLALVLAVSTGCSQSSSSPTAPPAPDTAAPMVVATTPANRAISFDPITATFNEPMSVPSVTTSTFSLVDEEGTIVPGFVQYQGDLHKALFAPSVDLVPGRTYTARITAGVQDVAGNPMASDVEWSFTIPMRNDPEVPRSD
jgi:ABC-type transport system substrate-binding protein